MNKRVVFLGGKSIGCGCLKSLIEQEVCVEAVVLNPRETYDNSRWYDSTAKVALDAGIPVLSFQSINDAAAIEIVSALHPDVMFCVFYDEVFSEQVVSIPRECMVNLHMALAEDYRGRFPCNYTILNQEMHTGVTLHHISANVDAGDIIATRRVPIEENDTAKSLYLKCTDAGVELFAEYAAQIINGTAPRRPQRATSQLRTYMSKDLGSKQVPLTGTVEDALRFVRAWTFPPFPPPHFYIGDTKMVIVPETSVNTSDYYQYQTTVDAKTHK